MQESTSPAVENVYTAATCTCYISILSVSFEAIDVEHVL